MSKELIKNNGLTKVGEMEFYDIEGGFGEGKKAMLVKDIAKIHNKEIKHVNELINKNRKRFKDNIDVIDLLGVGLNDTEIIELGITQNAINSYRGQKNKGKNAGIYLLSERGYSKLLKIMDDDFAWDQYDRLVDEYFSMRKEIIDNPYKNLSKELQAIFVHDEKIQKIEKVINQLQNDVPLYTSECEVLQNKLKAKIVKLLGGKSSPAYRNASLRKKCYIDIQSQIKREFGVNSYKAIARKNYQKALEIIGNYTLPTVLNDQVIKLNNQTQLEL